MLLTNSKEKYIITNRYAQMLLRFNPINYHFLKIKALALIKQNHNDDEV